LLQETRGIKEDLDMRTIILCLALQLAAPFAAVQMQAFDSPSVPAVIEVASLDLGAIQEAPPSEPAPPADGSKTDVSIEVRDGDESALPVSPVWLAIGGLGLLVLIMLIVMAVRNNRAETTVVRQ
jgi:hypothetical protein